jgi:hypothetical protein
MPQRRLVHLSHDAWDKPRCTICQAGRAGKIDLLRIEKLLSEKVSILSVARRNGLNMYALRRHWLGVSSDRKNYLLFGKRLTDTAIHAAVSEERLASIDHLRIARAAMHRGLQLALENSDLHAVGALGRSVAAITEQVARMTGEWHDEPRSVTNIAVLSLPQVGGIIAGISRVLAAHPAARDAVAAFLRTQHGGPVALPAPEVIDAAAE